MLVLPNKSAVVWDRFLTENKVLVYKYIVREIKKGLQQETDTIDLFRFEDNTMYAWIPKTKVLQTLNEAIQLFIKSEEYEYAQKTVNIVNSYHINNLIKESNKIED